MRRRILSFTFTLALSEVLIFASVSEAVDVMLYTGNTNEGWITKADMRKQADKIIKALKGKVASISDFDDTKLADIGSWVKANTADKDLDIIILFGSTPSTLYANPNKNPDGSPAEEFLNAGNLIVNVADYIFYCTYETGARGVDNGPAGLQNILNIVNITMLRESTQMKVTEAGKKFIPTLREFLSDRPFHVDMLEGSDWEPEEVFADTDGSGKANLADPIVIKNKKTNGRIFIAIQTGWENGGTKFFTRGEIVSEFILNWLLTRPDVSPKNWTQKLKN